MGTKQRIESDESSKNVLITSYMDAISSLFLPSAASTVFSGMCGQINAAACLNRGEVAELAENFARQPEQVDERRLSREAETVTATGKSLGGDRAGLPLLVKPPQLPVEDPTALGPRDEEDISQLETFFIKVS